MRYTPLSRQLNEAELKFLNDYENAILDAGSPLELDVALSKASNTNSDGTHSEMSERPWVKSLHAALIKEMHSEIEEASARLKAGESTNFTRCVLSTYLFKVEMGYKGYIGFGDKPLPGLKGLEKRGMDINEPHFKWLNQLDSQLNSLVESHPEIKPKVAFAYLYTVGDLAISLPDYNELRDEFIEGDYAGGLSMRDYVNWYIESLNKFDGDNLKIENATKMGKTLEAWTKDTPYTEETLSWLTRNYDIHPRHEKQVNSWAESYVALIKKQTPDSDLGLG